MDGGERTAHDQAPDGADEGPDAPRSCAVCSKAVDDPAAVLTWTLEHGDEGYRWICLQCSRDHLREIEARMDADEWFS